MPAPQASVTLEPVRCVCASRLLAHPQYCSCNYLTAPRRHPHPSLPRVTVLSASRAFILRLRSGQLYGDLCW
jgi:hypothetical protein